MTDRPLYDPPLVPPAYQRAVSRRPTNADIWAAARQLYASGATGPEVMERYGIGRSAFYDRARREGWLRKDQLAEAPLSDRYDDDPSLSRRNAGDMAAEAWGHVCRAVDRGRLAEARGWTAIFRDLRALAVLSAVEGKLVVVDPGDGRHSFVVLERPDSPDSLTGPAQQDPDSTDLTDSSKESGRLAA